MRGIKFLDSNQTLSGGFYMHALGINGTISGLDHLTPYTVSYVLHSIKRLPSDYIPSKLIERGLKFLEERNENGKWRYFDLQTARQLRVPYLPPDLDVTSVALIASHMYNVSFDTSDIDDLLKHKDESGLVYTYLGSGVTYENIDCAINLNMIYLFSLLGKENSVKATCDAVVRYNLSTACSVYYRQDEFVYSYFLSRALGIGKAECLEPLREPLVNRLLQIQKLDGSWGKGVFDTCLAMNSLYYLDSNYNVNKSIPFVLNKQDLIGVWPAEQFFEVGSFNPKDRHDITISYWGSEAITTAICLEALGNFMKSLFIYH